ncbi:hypothetical protein SAMN05216503_3394 [Polaribacter sp. KT25b]|uniref:hypothetical protein n=1 Tax=Polaribacter sp. KT25b TaxID=1855336 RepID=UPI00087B8DA2|nr:hypothetical protein [Polaribacter sp. KT25b]SDS54199.1 hypothetical protein SAMN05216503_3394 [Polaribacter sp. KT25b]
MKKKRFRIILTITVIILLIPLIAMQFTNEVNWKFLDFIVAGILLLVNGLVWDIAIRKIKKTKHLILVIIGILVIIALIWTELAVGIFGSPFAGS